VTQLEKELSAYKPARPMALTIGVFDGVHLGHLALITETLRQAKENHLLSGVVTFAGHPRLVLGKHKDLSHLTSLSQRVRLIKETGIDTVVVLSFTKELASVSAEEFLSSLVKYLKLNRLVIGPDFALGKGREGNIESIKTIGSKLGFNVTVVPALQKNGHKVSSTLIRKAMSESNMAKVHDFLGRYFSLEGLVVKGEGRGATIGIPTANIKVPSDQALPADGVYATIAVLDGKSMPSITNIGTRPTFGEGHRTIETHLFNFTGDLYGRSLEIAIIEQIRPEKRFVDAKELLSQINRDIEKAKELLNKTGCIDA